MSIRPENIARHELIGLRVTIADSSDPGQAGLSGRIVDETRNTFLLETKQGIKRIPKMNSSLIFDLPEGQRLKITGSILISQPENRINKRIQRMRWKL
ncbi:MAG: ribonuclease P protein component 1 [Methanotrichaceae archaeon]